MPDPRYKAVTTEEWPVAAVGRLNSKHQRTSMRRDIPRNRRPISAARAQWLRIAGFRYSAGRDAYVLRAIGNHYGPVFKVEHRPPGAANDESSTDDHSLAMRD
jgi:hypothetical protein